MLAKFYDGNINSHRSINNKKTSIISLDFQNIKIMENIKRNIIFVILALAFFIIIKVDFNQIIAKFTIVAPLGIILLTQFYLYFKIKYKRKI